MRLTALLMGLLLALGCAEPAATQPVMGSICKGFDCPDPNDPNDVFFDSNNGTDPSGCTGAGTVLNPYRTAGKAIACSRRIGADVWGERNSTVVNESYTITTGGTAEDPRTIGCYWMDANLVVYRCQPGERWTMRATGDVSRAFVLGNVEHVTIENTELDGVDDRFGPDCDQDLGPANIGKWLTTDTNTANHIILRRNSWRLSRGFNCVEIEGSSSDWLIENNTFDTCGTPRRCGDNLHRGDVLASRNTTRRIVVRNNYAVRGGHNAEQLEGDNHHVHNNLFESGWANYYGANTGYRITESNATNSIWERNVYRDGGCSSWNTTTGNAKLRRSGNIHRYNRFEYPATQTSFYDDCFGPVFSMHTGSNNRETKDHRVYNNEFWLTGQEGVWSTKNNVSDGSRDVRNAAFSRNVFLDNVPGKLIVRYRNDSADGGGQNTWNGFRFERNCIEIAGATIHNVTWGAAQTIPQAQAVWPDVVRENVEAADCSAQIAPPLTETLATQGEATEVFVADAWFFHVGDSISVGGEACTITARNTGTGKLTCELALEGYVAGEPVNLRCDDPSQFGPNGCGAVGRLN